MQYVDPVRKLLRNKLKSRINLLAKSKRGNDDDRYGQGYRCT